MAFNLLYIPRGAAVLGNATVVFVKAAVVLVPSNEVGIAEFAVDGSSGT